ncbi:hypothetical protein [Massilia sp. 9096]|uniref:hypothetical protein n=1 Tax=Massilia sp. 9096 TaxID=1500894 RepID=UPI0012E08979|nr:hypothetical protein [Massilia sp. 9096]
MTGRLFLLAVVSVVAAGVASVGAAAVIVTLPTIAAAPDKVMAPGCVSLMGAAVALAYGLLRPRKSAPARQARQASATDLLPWASMAVASTTPDSARPAATHSGDA